MEDPFEMNGRKKWHTQKKIGKKNYFSYNLSNSKIHSFISFIHFSIAWQKNIQTYKGEGEKIHSQFLLCFLEWIFFVCVDVCVCSSYYGRTKWMNISTSLFFCACGVKKHTTWFLSSCVFLLSSSSSSEMWILFLEVVFCFTFLIVPFASPSMK